MTKQDHHPDPDQDGFATRAIHVGSQPDPTTGAVIPPLSLSTTFAQDGVGTAKYDYSRSINPNREALETLLASLEHGSASIAYSSGSAATAAICQWLTLPVAEGGGRKGSKRDEIRVLSISDVYGGTYRYLKRVAEATTSIEVDFLDMSHLNLSDLSSALTPSTKLIWLESPTNPLLVVPPLQLISSYINSLPEETRPLVVVDNTFLSPYWSNPLELGADVVLQSISKYLNGHSDVIMGALIVKKGLEGRMVRGLKFLQNSSGGIPSPFDCFLAQRGIKTLPLRALQHGINALYIAHHLESNPLVSEVRYPGLRSNEYYERARWSLSGQAKRDLKRLGWHGLDGSGKNGDESGNGNGNGANGHGEQDKEVVEGGIPFSGMVTIRLHATEAQTEKFLQSLRLFALAESLGGVESLAEAPWKMTHGSIPVEERLKAGITENLVRLSVGVEDKEDLLRDLERALKIAIEG